jgi:hypothetical protein
MSTLSVANITGTFSVGIGNSVLNSTAIGVGSNVVINTTAINMSNAVVINTSSITVGSNINISTTAGLVVNSGLSDSIGNVREIPPVTKTSSYTLVGSDSGKMIKTSANVTIPSGIFSSGQTVTVYNNSSANITIIPVVGTTMYLVGTSTTGNRTLTQRGVATVICIDNNEFVITGGVLA